MIFRRQIGWLAAFAYVVTLRRRERVKRCLGNSLVVPVLFHSPSPGQLDGILSSLDSLVGMENVEITFDDGRAVIKDCVQVLEKYSARAVFFISPGEIEAGFNWAERAHRVCPRDFASLLRMSGEERLEALSLYGKAERELLTPEDVARLSAHPLVEFGNHTWSHASCVNRPADEILREIERAQAKIAEWTGAVPGKFSYPFGHSTPGLDAAIRRMGLVPYSLRPGLAPCRGSGIFRNMACEDMTLLENTARLLTAWPRVRRMPS